ARVGRQLIPSLCHRYSDCRSLSSFPTRRSSDLLWLMVSLALFVLGAIPAVLDAASQALGFEVPSNFLFFAGFGLILLVTLQLSRSEEHTSERQSRENLVCRLLLEKKKKNVSLNL